ncbi:MAG: dockerin type I domain-containing protein [Clostridiales bacterium]|nr:dockerin type I domain-containing protein [Clostridiales bacterium]
MHKRSKTLKRILLSLLILCLMPAYGFALGTEPEIEFFDGVPIQPNVRPVIVVSGTDYEMGYQFAQQVIQIFGTWYYEKMASERNLTEQELAAVKAKEQYVTKETPEMIDYVRGISDGAASLGVAISYYQALAFFTGVRTYDNALAKAEPEAGSDASQGCSGWAAWGSATKDGKLIFAGSGDHEIGSIGGGIEYTLIAFPSDGNNYIVSPPTGAEGHPGMNNKGVTYVHHGAGVRGNYQVGHGIPALFALMHTMRYADDAVQAKKMMLEYTSSETSYQRGGLLADVSGNMFVIECKDPVVVREPGDYGEKDFIFSSNNSMVPELKEFLRPSYDWELRYIDHGGWHGYSESSVQRNLGMWNMLHNYNGKIDKAFAEMMWRFPASPPAYPTLEEADKALYATQGKGWDMKIASMENANTAYGIPDKGNEGLYYVSNGRVARLTAPLDEGGHFYYPNMLYVFIELKLDANPQKVVEAARARAQYDLWDANLKLSKLTYFDTAYVALHKKFDVATKSWVSGNWYLDLAKASSGNESVNYFGKAMRSFTTCQAYAKHVFNALAPPAASPEDLGLRKWFGDWGEWAVDPYAALDTTDSYSASVNVSAESDIDKNVEVALSLTRAKNVLTFEAEIVINGSMLSSIGIEPQNGFTVINDIAWRNMGGDIWRGTVTLGYKAGNDEGFTAIGPVDIAKFMFAPRAKGETAIELTGAKSTGLVGDVTKYLDVKIVSGKAVTNIDQRAFSKYDLNKDNRVDALDLGVMLLYCGFDSDSPNWGTLVKVNDSKGSGVTASMCDVNADGVIDMLDLLDLFIHYTK